MMVGSITACGVMDDVGDDHCDSLPPTKQTKLAFSVSSVKGAEIVDHERDGEACDSDSMSIHMSVPEQHVTTPCESRC